MFARGSEILAVPFDANTLRVRGTLVARTSDTGNIWLLQMNDKKALRPLLETPYGMRGATISPDGRWLAYASNETNRFEVYVQAFPNPAAKYQISTDGGTEPIWAKSGLKLFYRNGDKMMSVAIDVKGDSIEPRTPVLLFEGRFAVSPLTMGDAWYDVCPERPTVLDAENRRGAKQYRQHRHGPGLDERAETTRATEVGSLGLRR